jgi:hypothetical protein
MLKGLRFWNRLIKFICKFQNEKIAEIAKLNWVQNIELIAAPESDNLPGVSSHKSQFVKFYYSWYWL